MKTEKKLKEWLREIKNNDWRIPKDIDPYQLSVEMMQSIGSTDPELRDKLIYSGLWAMISKKVLTEKQIKKVLALSLSEEHLFYKVGQKEDDSVFNRAFSILIVAAVIWVHNQNGEKLLTDEEVLKVHRDVVRYTRLEQDVRGHVDDKGWAHSTAHAADALDELAQCSSVQDDELLEILEVIKEKVNIHDYSYVHEEDERLVTAVINIMKRNLIHEDELVRWIESFKNYEETNHYLSDYRLKVNLKNFMRSLYFRLKGQLQSDSLQSAVEGVLDHLNVHYK
ncbi:DUF2785 domain-containing protein [Chengkuizengella axinellae]|uniref:DUF2785 domain-containing protein n=1 Tax=Chengkuizengella axinellae TaxID=3064388 RepID=A0ABT9J2M5_9BACL|nr:DUF2785 domain-containing protein [Chengkuizengella sp. 2205SS18-9]MDP5275860.1 DUF2785 domain-containing protein [Chengkuizengella sp. 2205SS18-9]